MRYFNFLTREEEKDTFHCKPISFNSTSNKELLAYAIGAALYMPATRQTIADDLLIGKHEGLVSMVIDLEDAIGDNQIELAEESLLQQLHRVSSFLKLGSMSVHHLPLIFIRIRTPDQMKRIIAKLEEDIELITGFAFPKFTAFTGQQYFQLLAEYNENQCGNSPTLYGMPILESTEILYRESRMHELLSIKELLNQYKAYVLNVRIGATDFSSLFGLRRSADMTLYDISVIRDTVSDIINVFGRMDNHYVISGAVWEYFKSDRVVEPRIKHLLIEESIGRNGRTPRMNMTNPYMDGLVREVILDKENGIIGKTIIHPSHIKLVQALYIVTHEEYVDASHIIANNNGYLGVLKSQYSNKMNEIKPHLNWAHRIMIRSKIYGVLHENQSFVSLLSDHQYQHQFQ
jgi:citrate lyase beta subunit